MEMEERTVDKVFCGEQQSESDHFFSSSNAWNGTDEGIHWRRARGAFSYQMKADGATQLLLKGFSDREAVVVTLNEQPIGTAKFDRQGRATVALPQGISGTATLKLAAEQGKQTPRISEVRLLK